MSAVCAKARDIRRNTFYILLGRRSGGAPERGLEANRSEYICCAARQVPAWSSLGSLRSFRDTDKAGICPRTITGQEPLSFAYEHYTSNFHGHVKMSKPSIVFVPGSYVLVSAYQPILEALSDQGYEVTAVTLPTIGPASRQGRDEPAPPMYEDAEAIAQEVKKISDQGKDVIIVGHSYAGIPMSQSTEGLDKKARSTQGKPGGVTRLAFLAALVPPKGGSAASLLGRFSDDHRPTVAIDVSVTNSATASYYVLIWTRTMVGCPWKTLLRTLQRFAKTCPRNREKP